MARFIRRQRLELGVTLDDLARLGAPSSGAVSRIERAMASPRVDILEELLLALNTNVRYLSFSSRGALYGGCTASRVAQRVAKLRKKCQLSQASLARRAGLSQGVVWGLEYGAYRPTLTSLYLISKVLHVKAVAVRSCETLHHYSSY